MRLRFSYFGDTTLAFDGCGHLYSALLPDGLSSHQPGPVPLALGSEQRVHFLCFVLGEQQAPWQDLFADSASGVTASVKDRVA